MGRGVSILYRCFRCRQQCNHAPWCRNLAPIALVGTTVRVGASWRWIGRDYLYLFTKRRKSSLTAQARRTAREWWHFHFVEKDVTFI